VTRTPGGLVFADVVIDSRQVQPGSLFVALPGEHGDGHAYVHDALERGAAGALVHQPNTAAGTAPLIRATDSQISERLDELKPPVLILTDDTLAGLQRIAAYWRALGSVGRDVPVVAVTGSVGKTTAKEVIAGVLEQRYQVLKNPGNLNNEIGLPLTLLQLAGGEERAVLEMGMYAQGEIDLLCRLARPRTGVVTNVGPVHLERLGTMAAIVAAKSELPAALPLAPEGTAILNGDDPLVRGMAQQTSAQVLFYGLDPSCDLWAGEVESRGLDGVTFRLHHGDESMVLKTPLLGRHSVHTALAAAAVGLVEGLTWPEIARGLTQTREQLRIIVLPGANGSTIIDDTYNASPDSVIAALNLLAELDGRHIGVLGDMLELGRYEEEGHRLVGRRAAEVLQVLMTVGDLGRLIGEEARDAGLADVRFAADNAGAIEHLRALLQPGDHVLIKGSRGMQMEEIVAAVAVPSTSEGTKAP
jgi:UDP-N-acetylmuramoyl-tripeptide--D-alanyl-D-alanine ligase